METGKGRAREARRGEATPTPLPLPLGHWCAAERYRHTAGWAAGRRPNRPADRQTDDSADRGGEVSEPRAASRRPHPARSPHQHQNQHVVASLPHLAVALAASSLS